MILTEVISAMGLKGGASHSSYDEMVSTWRDSNEPVPTYEQCEAKWNELVASGMFEPPYFVKRAAAYAEQGIYLQDIAELTAELNMAQAAQAHDDVAKYTARLQELYAKRSAIKAQYPKA